MSETKQKPKPAKDFTGYAVMDGLGKVQIMVKNGYISTGYKHLDRSFPTLLRQLEGRIWVSGVTETVIDELRGFYPSQVVKFYHAKANEAARKEREKPFHVPQGEDFVGTLVAA